MSRRTIVGLAAFVVISIGCTATISTDAFARAAPVSGGTAVHHDGVYRGAAGHRGVAVGVGAAAVGVAARR